jgi:hypothetical protein
MTAYYRRFPLWFTLMAMVFLPWLPAEDVDQVEESGGDKKPGITVIVSLTGSAQVSEQEGAPAKAAEQGQLVPVGATIQTGPDGIVDLALSNGALFQLQENTRFTIGTFEQEAYEFVFSNGAAIRPRELKEFGADEAILQTLDASEEAWNKLEKEPTTSLASFQLAEGAMIGFSKKLAPGSRMEIVTPIGVAGIRGTKWFLRITPVTGTGGTQFRGRLDVAEGRVDFGDSSGTRAVQVQGGFSMAIDASSPSPGEVRVNSLNTTAMPAERVAMLQSSIVTVENRQTYFAAVQGNPDVLEKVADIIARTQSESGESGDAGTTQAQTGISKSDLPPPLPDPPRPPPAPTPTPAPTPNPPIPTPTPSPTLPPPTPTPTPTPKPSNI